MVRELWQTRDEIARDADLSPRRVLSDQAIIDAARAEAAKPPPTGRPQLERISGFHARYARKHAERWVAAVLRARQLDDAELPEVAGRRGAAGPAARAPLGGARPGRGGPAGGRAGGRQRARDRAPAACREPAPAGRAAPAGLGTAGPGDRRGDRRGADAATVPAPGRRS